MRIRLYSWHEFLNKLKEQDREDWVTVLTAALQIYVFDMKGFASVPDEKNLRESILKGSLKDMLMHAIEDIIQRLWRPDKDSTSGSGSKGGTDKEKLGEKLNLKPGLSKEIFMSDGTDVIAIKLAI
jgi:hypothetical protein